MKFYLGTNKANWLQKSTVPLFISHRTLKPIRTRKPSKVDWCLDSGGFTELTLHGEWKTSPEEYAFFANMYRNGFGRMQWASQQDWMVEDFMLTRTGRTLQDHQTLTVQNWLDLKRIAPNFPFIPVIQGQTTEHYLDHVRQFKDAGVDLRTFDTIGIGSVCRRQASNEIEPIITELHAYGLSLHGFGMKTLGLRKIAHKMRSADSMAWSFKARMERLRLPDCTHKAPRCSDCLTYATQWRNELLESLPALVLTA